MDPHSSHAEIGEKRRFYDETLVAAAMSESIVDGLEVVDVERDDGEGVPIARKAHQFVLDGLGQAPPVG